MLGNIFNKNKDSKEENKENQEIPDSLPSTMADKHKQENTAVEKEEVKEDKHKLPEDLHEPPRPVQKVNVSEEPPKEETVEVEEKVEETEKVEDKAEEKQEEKPKASHSYFNDLEKKFAEEKSVIENHFSNDILVKMKEYHDAKIKGNMYFFDKSDLDDHVYRLLLELKELEAEWSIRFRELETAKKLVTEKEEEIEKKLAEFKGVFDNKRKFDLLNKKAGDGMEFKLANGHVVSSLHELLFELKHMSEEVFSHHVSDEKNDFEAWIKHVFNNKELGDRVAACKTIGEMVEVLKKL